MSRDKKRPLEPIAPPEPNPDEEATVIQYDVFGPDSEAETVVRRSPLLAEETTELRDSEGNLDPRRMAERNLHEEETLILPTPPEVLAHTGSNPVKGGGTLPGRPSPNPVKKKPRRPGVDPKLYDEETVLLDADGNPRE